MDIEKRLEASQRRGPSEALEGRVGRLFADAAMDAPPLWARPVRLWQCALACLVCLSAGVIAARVLFPPEPQRITHEQTVYIVPMDSTTLATLTNPPRREPQPYQVYMVPPRDGKPAPL